MRTQTLVSVAVALCAGFLLGRITSPTAPVQVQLQTATAGTNQLHTTFECEANGVTWIEGIGADGYTCHVDPAKRTAQKL